MLLYETLALQRLPCGKPHDSVKVSTNDSAEGVSVPWRLWLRDKVSNQRDRRTGFDRVKTHAKASALWRDCRAPRRLSDVSDTPTRLLRQIRGPWGEARSGGPTCMCVWVILPIARMASPIVVVDHSVPEHLAASNAPSVPSSITIN